MTEHVFYHEHMFAVKGVKGHVWEVAHNPGFGLDDEGNVVLPVELRE